MTDISGDTQARATGTPTAPGPRGGTATRAVTWSLNRPVLQVVVLLALAGILVASVPAVANPRSVVAILTLSALLALAAMGQTLVVILGGLDLAAPGYILIGAYVAVELAGKNALPLPLAFLLTIAFCGAIGALVGWICHRFKVQPLVITLGVGAALSGATLFLANGNYDAAPPPGLRAVSGMTSTSFGLPVPPVVIVVAMAAVLLWLFLNRTPAGRSLYATGINVRAAGLTRIRTGVVWTLVFAASGAIAGVAGMFIAGFGSGWSQSTGDPYLFSGLAAVLVGGTTFGSIRGSYTRTVLGALILTVLSTLIVSNGMNESQSRIVYGVIILAVVSLYGRERHVRDRF